MATRKETAQRKLQLEKWLRDWAKQPDALAGGLLSSNRDLAEKYELSTFSVFSVIQSLVAEGVLTSERGVGVFSAGARNEVGFFAVITNLSHSLRDSQLFEGFRTKVAEFGLPSVIVSQADVERWQVQGNAPHIAGVLSLNYTPDGQSIPLIDAPTVGFYGLGSATWNTVAFDDYVGGYWATKHLISTGHKRIAFLGMHYPDGKVSLDWSKERCEGWSTALVDAGFATTGLNIRNTTMPGTDDMEVGRLAAQRVLDTPGCTAVIAVNSLVAAGFLLGLEEARLPRVAWPAIVCFQDSDVAELVNMSSIYLDYCALGKAAAETLLQPDTSSETPRVLRVTPQLMPSLTSRSGWAQAMHSSGENSFRWLHDLIEPERAVVK
ncbi:MAG: substrate-binding domain-containing protein [Fimbriimonadaceae bacterium]|jgi:DNA-binding LacI/PurR family transcriptional regulator|nr:substrate-binding domain-containing protein [Fimbriimonadaceae bacterium]